MGIERESRPTSLIDVLDRVLDKGIVIDAWLRLSLAGIQLLSVETRVFVASIETYLIYGSMISQVPLASAPGGSAIASQPLFPRDASPPVRKTRPP
jgi:gas vesicle structural protein